MYCPKCGNNMGNSSFCQNCGMNVGSFETPVAYRQVVPKKKFYQKWWFWVLAVFIILSFIGRSLPDSDKSQSESKASTTSTTQKTITYNIYSITELFDELDSNAMRAKQLHENEYIQVTGYLDIIDASGDYFSIGAGENNYDYYMDDIQLSFKNDKQRQQVMNLSKGNKITVRCYISTVGEIVGYMGDLIEIV